MVSRSAAVRLRSALLPLSREGARGGSTLRHRDISVRSHQTPRLSDQLEELDTLAARVARALPGWSLRRDIFGWWLIPPDGDWSIVRTQADLEVWLHHQERWGGARAQAPTEEE